MDSGRECFQVENLLEASAQQMLGSMMLHMADATLAVNCGFQIPSAWFIVQDVDHQLAIIALDDILNASIPQGARIVCLASSGGVEICAGQDCA